MSRVQVSSHPLVAHHVVALRDPATKPPEFRRTVGQITRLLAVEATTTVPTKDVWMVEVVKGERTLAGH